MSDRLRSGVFVPSMEVHAEFAKVHSQDELFNRYGLFNVQTAWGYMGEAPAESG